MSVKINNNYCPETSVECDALAELNELRDECDAAKLKCAEMESQYPQIKTVAEYVSKLKKQVESSEEYSKHILEKLAEEYKWRKAAEAERDELINAVDKVVEAAHEYKDKRCTCNYQLFVYRQEKLLKAIRELESLKGGK